MDKKTILKNDQIIIIEAGSYATKVGLAGEDKPQVIVPSWIGEVKDNDNFEAFDKSEYIGDDALRLADVLDMKQIVKDGKIKPEKDRNNTVVFDAIAAFGKLLRYAFNALHVNPREAYGVIFIEAPGVPKIQRRNIVELLFRNFEIQRLQIRNQAVMALTSVGKTKGLVVDIGHQTTTVTPVYDLFDDGQPWAFTKKQKTRKGIAGSAISAHIASQVEFTTGFEKDTPLFHAMIMDQIKKHVYVGASAQQNNEFISYTLPTGERVRIPDNILRNAAEPIFNPIVIKKPDMELKALVFESISCCVSDMHPSLLTNILLIGGTSLIPGIDKKLQQQMCDLAQSCNVTPSYDAFASFRGASQIGISTQHDDGIWVSNDDLEMSTFEEINAQFWDLI